MTENLQTLHLQHKRRYSLTEGPVRHTLKHFHDLQEQHRATGTLRQLSPIAMLFNLQDDAGIWRTVEVLVTALEGFDGGAREVRILGLFELAAVIIKYDIPSRSGTFKYK